MVTFPLIILKQLRKFLEPYHILPWAIRKGWKSQNQDLEEEKLRYLQDKNCPTITETEEN